MAVSLSDAQRVYGKIIASSDQTTLLSTLLDQPSVTAAIAQWDADAIAAKQQAFNTLCDQLNASGIDPSQLMNTYLANRQQQGLAP